MCIQAIEAYCVSLHSKVLQQQEERKRRVSNIERNVQERFRSLLLQTKSIKKTVWRLNENEWIEKSSK